jgi:hypothetical protein
MYTQAPSSFEADSNHGLDLPAPGTPHPDSVGNISKVDWDLCQFPFGDARPRLRTQRVSLLQESHLLWEHCGK